MAKRRDGRAPVQGELEMAIGESPADDEAPVAEAEPAEPAADAGDPASEVGEPAADAGDPATGAAGSGPEAIVSGGDRLQDALEGLDRRVTLLIERHQELGQRHARALEGGRRAEAALARLTERGGDPAELDARIRSLEAENERLARHAGFLEERIRNLLSRVRYVIES